ncbi:MAG: S24 family peptidase [Cyanobacteriota bacterium]|nr:S24 family peptidase [Cyanobacteriota bacterium]
MLVTLPVAEAGFPSPAGDYLEKALDLHRLLVPRPAATFFMRATGDPMVEAGIWPEDILVVDKSLEPRPNRIVVAVVEGELRLMRIRAGSEVEVWGVVTAGIHFMG